ncbi:MAG: type II secretion system protein GspL [Thermaurantiacus sp.]|uniref:type II secretion system protein GspL n=1 Tax=Thermaurantiacus sp. TaxID=2820283 RepID=UPI00298EDFD2|nr:type II secretion system protein GspL [Thermaurantiacus sp.]MDW8415342.1 type II secretion system protein GspL [Thermaurantiacus sp.]
MSRYLILDEEGLKPLGPPADGPAVALLATTDVVAHRLAPPADGSRPSRSDASAHAAELAAQPVDDLHLALGPPGPDGHRWLALVSRERMAELCRSLADAGVERVLPAALVLPAPAGATPSAAAAGGLVLVRGADFAGSAEPELAQALGAPPTPPPLEAVLPPEPPADAPDLLQGAFAPARPFWRARGFRLAAVALALVAGLFLAVPPAARYVRGQAERQAADAAAVAIAARALGEEMTDPAQATARLLEAARQHPEAGLAERLARLFAALEPEPRVELTRLEAGPDGRLVATLSGPPEAVNAIAQRLRRQPLSLRQDGERLILGPPRPRPPATARDRLEVARLLAPQVAQARRRAPGPPQARLADALGGAGILAKVEGSASRATARIEAVRPTLLFPLLARLEAQGFGITRLQVARNADPSLSATLEVR